MITVSVEGLDDIIEAIRKIPSSLDRETIFSDVADEFADRLKSATPEGYSGKLEESVLFRASNDEAEVGYEDGVESAGNPAYDSVTAARGTTTGRSVLARRAVPRRPRRTWVQTSELQSVLQETFDSYAPEAVTTLEAHFAEEIDNVGS